jgi:anthranilate phosphoribosyltransferase
MVVHGSGLDEITNTGETVVSELKEGSVISYRLQPEDLGYPSAKPGEIAGGTPLENARKLVEIMNGLRSPARDIVAINSGAALYVSGKVESLKDGAYLAEDSLNSGRALALLERMVKMNGEPARLERFL